LFELHSRTLAEPQVQASGDPRRWSAVLILSVFGASLLEFRVSKKVSEVQIALLLGIHTQAYLHLSMLLQPK
jgi:hypothetical protein